MPRGTPTRQPFAWTPENVAALSAYWKADFSASEISKLFGGAVTRNAVIGKAHRLRLNKKYPHPRHARAA